MADAVAKEVLQELFALREDNASLRQELAMGFKRVESKISTLEHRAPAAAPPAGFSHSSATSALSSFSQTRCTVGAAASRQAYTCWEDDEDVKRFLYKGGWLTEPDLNGQWGPRRSELGVIADALGHTSFNGAIAVAEAKEGSSSSPSSPKKAFNVSDLTINKQDDRLDRPKKVSFFHHFLGAAEKGLDGDRRGRSPEERASIIPLKIRDTGSSCTNGIVNLCSTFLSPIHPSSAFRTRWDFFVLLLLVYVCFTAPVIVCFDITIEQGVHNLWYFETFVNISFAIDILLNLNTAYFDNEEKLVTSRAKIIKAYVTGWMIVDALAVFPIELLTPDNEVEAAQLAKGLRLAKFTRILRVLRVIKLLRILKVPALLRRIEGATGRGGMRSLMVVGGAILITHLAACGFFYAAHLHHEDSLGAELERMGMSWSAFQELPEETMTEMRLEAWKMTWVGTSGLGDFGSVSRYITALYWAMSTLTTVGYGDVTPANDAERLVSMVAMVIGVTVFAYFMGNTASLIAAMNSSETVVHRKLAQMDTFLRQRHVPRQLTDKIRKFYNLAVHHQVIEDDHMVNQLSMPLRTELLLFLYRDTLEKVPFFKGQDPQFITSLVSRLRMEYYAEGDIVIQEGDLGNLMYFVVSGFLEARQYHLGEISDTEGDDNDAVEGEVATDDYPDGKGLKLIHKLKKKMGITRKEQGGLLPTSRVPSQADYRKIPQQWRFYSNVRDLDLGFDIIDQLYTGEHFGEYSCLLGHPRTSTVVALDFSELYCLSREELMEVYRQWPELHEEFQELVRQFQEITGMVVAEDGDEGVTVSGNLPADRMPDPQTSESVNLPGQTGPPTTFGGKTEIQGLDRGLQTEMQNAQQTTDSSGASKVAAILNSTEIEHNPAESADLPRRKSTDSSAKARQKTNTSMKHAVNLMMNMQQFENLASNPVFQLLNNGHDLRGVIGQTQREMAFNGEDSVCDESVRLGSDTGVAAAPAPHGNMSRVRRSQGSATGMRSSIASGSSATRARARASQLEPIPDTGSPLIKAATEPPKGGGSNGDA